MPRLAALKYIWASPASAVGVTVAAAALLFGASARVHTGVLEVSLQPWSVRLAKVVAGLPFSAITFGHVVLARTEEEQSNLRVHERVHVCQYEAWGPALLLAYPAESLIQLFLGRHPYRDNRFEVSARATETRLALAGGASGA